jgi:predicted transglutaminase-like protease
MELNIQYSNAQIEKIRDQGFIYMCACPSQVSEQISYLRRLFTYQRNCITSGEMLLDAKTHELIANATNKAHDIMQTCLHDVLIHEGWDLNTLEMPDGLRQLLEKTLSE